MSGLVKLVVLLLRTTKEVRFSRLTVILIVIAGAIAGVATTGLVALVNGALNASGMAKVPLAVGFLGLCIVLPATRFVSQALLIRLSQGVAYDLRLRLSRRILAAPLRQLEELGSSRLLAVLTEDVGMITAAVANVPLFLMNVVVVLSCLGYLGWLSADLLILLVGFLVFGVITYQAPILKAQSSFQVAREQRDSLFARLLGLTEGAKELKIHKGRREAFVSRLLKPVAETLRKTNIVGNVVHAMAGAWGQILSFIMLGIILFVAPVFVDAGKEVLTGYALTVLFMLAPLEVILRNMPVLGQAAVSVAKIEKLGLSLEHESAGESPARPMAVAREATTLPEAPTDWKTIELADITHTYYREDEDDTFTMGPISARFEPGELVFLIGGNGSGKTSLVKLLVGLYGPENGELRLDGKPVDDEGRDAYRQLFATVFSDFFLFDNLIGLESPRLDEQTRQYLAQLHLDRKVKVEDGVLSTVELSAGQRKRLALLTAYLEDRPFYVFDEWAADQDPQFKDIFYRQLVPELRARGKTVVVVTHDDRYFGLADRIIRLEYGQVIYDGSAELYLNGKPSLAIAAARGN